VSPMSVKMTTVAGELIAIGGTPGTKAREEEGGRKGARHGSPGRPGGRSCACVGSLRSYDGWPNSGNCGLTIRLHSASSGDCRGSPVGMPGLADNNLA